MKYVRFGNELLEVLSENLEYVVTNKGQIIGNDIIDESDNIEDLFDWVVLRDGGIRFLSDTLDNAIAYAGNDFLSYEVIGAIETDESLKYVAKMKWFENDDKWEWELL